jgi:hypothetical protein
MQSCHKAHESDSRTDLNSVIDSIFFGGMITLDGLQKVFLNLL